MTVPLSHGMPYRCSLTLRGLAFSSHYNHSGMVITITSQMDTFVF